MLLNKDGKHRGLAYISYETRTAADAALELDGIDFKGRVLSVKTSVQQRAGSKEVFVKHFPRDQPDDALRKVFAACGAIESLKIPRWDDGEAKGMAFVVFKDSQGFKKALELDGKKIGEKWLEVAKSGRGSDEGVKSSGKGKGAGKNKAAGKSMGKSRAKIRKH